MEQAKEKCKDDPNCQSFHRDRDYGYYYYTGKDPSGNVLDGDHPAITDNQKGECTSDNAQVENRGSGAELYIKKSNEEIAPEATKAGKRDELIKYISEMLKKKKKLKLEMSIRKKPSKK